MSLGKAIKHGKEKRKIYRGSKAFDRSCRNHGGCPWCEEGRMHSTNKRKVALEYDEEMSELPVGEDVHPEGI
jgi:hypothetical protein